jgi:hypothetical protein
VPPTSGKSQRDSSIPPIPSYICTSQGREQNTCNEAVILREALLEFTRAWRRHFAKVPQHEWVCWDAQQALRHFLSASGTAGPHELGALALAVLLFLSKYSRLSPLSHTSMSSLYSVYHYRKGCKPWWRERSEAHLLQFAGYLDILCFGSPDHDGVETLQAALGFNVHSGAGIAMPLVALMAGTPRNVASVFGRLLRLLPQRCRLHLDVSGDWYETLLAVAAGWIRPSANPHVLHQQLLILWELSHTLQFEHGLTALDGDKLRN